MNESTNIGSCCELEIDNIDTRPAQGPEVDDELATLARAIAHPVRIRILRILIRKGSSICGKLVEEVDLAQSTVSQHLKVLKEAGLISGDIDGPRVSYCVNPNELRRLRILVSGL